MDHYTVDTRLKQYDFYRANKCIRVFHTNKPAYDVLKIPNSNIIELNSFRRLTVSSTPCPNLTKLVEGHVVEHITEQWPLTLTRLSAPTTIKIGQV